MSRLITIKHNKRELVDLIDRLMTSLTKDALSPGQRTATATHLDALKLDARPWEVACTLQGDETGRTKLTIMIAPRG